MAVRTVHLLEPPAGNARRVVNGGQINHRRINSTTRHATTPSAYVGAGWSARMYAQSGYAQTQQQPARTACAKIRQQRQQVKCAPRHNKHQLQFNRNAVITPTSHWPNERRPNAHNKPMAKNGETPRMVKRKKNNGLGIMLLVGNVGAQWVAMARRERHLAASPSSYER